jgi:signal transduction histidine kinase/DNA-binding response OmpR family regulator
MEMENGEIVNILVVDDLPEKLLVYETILERPDQNLMTARSGREALRHLLEREFAVILLDVNMPDMDGFETAAMIRSRRQTAHTPIIFITAFNDEMNTAQGYSLGAVDYILSPVVPDILRTKVGVFVDLYKKTQQLKQQADQRVALAREQAARAAAEETTRQLAFLAEASTALARSLKYQEIPRRLACLAIPFLADLCAVTLSGDETTSTSTCPGACASPDPGWTELAWIDSPGVASLQAPLTGETPRAFRFLAALSRRVLETGRPELHVGILNMSSRHDLACTTSPRGGPGPGFEPRSAIVVPLQARGRSLGTIALGRRESARPYAPSDLALAEDLARRAAIAIDNARLYRDIQENDRRKNEFLAMLAHELRNPLAPIRNAVEVLRRLGLKDADLEWANEIIGRQVEQLARLVDDLLDISRITGGKIQLRTEPVEIALVVARAVETSRPLIDARRHVLNIVLPAEPLRVDVDAVRIAQVLANLLNNAAKYTGEGGKIELEVAREGAEVVVRVRDNGVGIAPEILPRIFDLFTQADRSLDRSQGGLGIGLTLVRRLVQMHGGTVQAFSAGANRGSEFVIRLPALTEAAPSAVADPEHPAAHATVNHTHPRRILIVDDQPDGVKSLARLLRLSGHEVRTALDGPAALGELSRYRPEVVLLDIGLPGMDGYELAQSIRKQWGTESMVLIALTGYGRDEDRRRSREAGFDHHLVKPVDPETLLSMVAVE